MITKWGRSELFHSAKQRVLVGARIFVDVRDLGLGNLSGEDAAHALAAGMHMQHHLHRLLLIEIEEASQYLYHEIHRGKVIIQQKDLKKWRTSHFGLGGFHRQTATAALFVFGFVGHDFLGSSF
jgi:hypothetical protein